MEVLIENIITYSIVIILILSVLYFQLRKKKKHSQVVKEKIERAKELGIHEPVSLHPEVNPDICLGSGACVKACPEKDIIGLVDGRAALINASRCVGHGACFHACPVGAITLVIGTEKRGVDLPHVNTEFETNVKGIYIAGELGGMGLIKNAVAQGKQAIENISKNLSKVNANVQYDLVIVGAGPAGIAASLAAKEKKLKFVTIDQDSLGGTVYSFPRKKIVMTSPMHLPLHGKIKFYETTKTELLNFWTQLLNKNEIRIRESEKIISVIKDENHFIVNSAQSSYSTKMVLLAIGRRGSPRKLNVPGEEKEKVAYRLIEPELITNQNVLIVGGGDSAIEAALALIEENNVTLSYRGDSFSRIKPKNFENIKNAESSSKIRTLYNSNVKEIRETSVLISCKENEDETIKEIPNDLVYILAGGELPIEFLEKTGIRITKKFGEAVLSH